MSTVLYSRTRRSCQVNAPCERLVSLFDRMSSAVMILLLSCGLGYLCHLTAQDNTANSATAVVERLQMHHHHVQNRHSAPLSSILNYTFTTPEIQLRKGLTHLGSNWRLRRALRHVVHHAGATLSIGAIGGSVTCGHGASNPDVG